MQKTAMKILAAGKDCKPEVVVNLEELGCYKIFETADGLSAWNFLKNNQVEIVFADWQLGQFDGLVLLKIMLADKNLCNIPVVLLSPQANREMVIDAGQAGVSAILTKPFSKITIEQKIAALFDIHAKEKDVKAETLLAAGNAYFQKEEYDRAIVEYEKVIALYENPEVYYNIGYIRAAQQRYDESIVAFRKAINIDKKFAEAYKALGQVYSKIGLADKAEKMLNRAGEIYMEKNMSQEAEIAFNEVLKLNPGTTNIYNSLGILYRRTKQFSKAIQTYEKALKIDSNDENIFFNLGRACYESGLLKQAKLYLEKALEIYADFDAARNILLQVDRKLKEP